MKVVAAILIEVFVIQLTSEQMLSLLLMNQVILTSTQFYNNSFMSKISKLLVNRAVW